MHQKCQVAPLICITYWHGGVSVCNGMSAVQLPIRGRHDGPGGGGSGLAWCVDLACADCAVASTADGDWTREEEGNGPPVGDPTRQHTGPNGSFSTLWGHVDSPHKQKTAQPLRWGTETRRPPRPKRGAVGKRADGDGDNRAGGGWLAGVHGEGDARAAACEVCRRRRAASWDRRPTAARQVGEVHALDGGFCGRRQGA